MLKKKIEEKAKKIGFDLVGFCEAKVCEDSVKAFDNWLGKKYEGGMEYMRKREERKNLDAILPGAKSVIVLAVNYYHEQEELKEGHGRVARFAYGRDYHKIIGKWLKELEGYIKEISPPGVKTKTCIDSAPILERTFAEQAGIGFVGENSLLITPEFGSWVFLAEIVTDLELGISRFFKKVKFSPGTCFSCGGCKQCMNACPTGAIVAPGVIDARRCIAYQTIENKEKIPADIAEKIKEKKLLFGCDICQEVCLHNQKNQKITTHSEFLNPKIAGDSLSTQKILSIKSDQQFVERFAGSPLMRAKRKGLQRNAKTLNGF